MAFNEQNTIEHFIIHKLRAILITVNNVGLIIANEATFE